MYNVLLVDDEPHTVEALKKRVDWTKCGIRNVSTAYSKDGAINIIRSNKIDIIVCDIEMPNGSGLNLLQWIRQQDIKIACIFVTCHPEFDYMRKAIQLRCFDYMLKPIRYPEFERVLTELVYKLDAEEAGDTGSSDFDLKEEKVDQGRDVEQEIKRYVREHLSEDIKVGDIADELCFNAQYIARAFKNKTGVSINEYVAKTRISLAQKILSETALPVKEVSRMVGYADYAYFSRVFSKELGISPSKYRESYLSN